MATPDPLRKATAARRAPQDTHSCPGRCGRQVPNRLFACGPHWYRLPRDMQRGITGNRRGTDAHWQAIADAMDWHREQDERKTP